MDCRGTRARRSIAGSAWHCAHVEGDTFCSDARHAAGRRLRGAETPPQPSGFRRPDCRAAQLLAREGVGAWVHYKLDKALTIFLSMRRRIPARSNGASSNHWLRISLPVKARDPAPARFSLWGMRSNPSTPSRARDRSALRRNGHRRRGEWSAADRFSIRCDCRFLPLTADVLSAVDQVFAVPTHAKGLSAEGEPVIHDPTASAIPVPSISGKLSSPIRAILRMTGRHRSIRPGSGTRCRSGRSDCPSHRRIGWPTNDYRARQDEADRAGGHSRSGSQARCFVNALTRALKRRGNIPVAGADRLRLTSHIAVQDLMALGRFILQPHDDLSLVPPSKARFST